ncbi:MAG: malate dehydrogenase [Anaerolineales bacterium]|jgi:malate dehydrogenase
MRNRITIVGAGQTGSTAAQWLAAKETGDIILLDIADGLAQGKALDLLEALPIIHSDVMVRGVNRYEETAGSDVVIITAGIARKPGMSREDLLKTNADIVRSSILASCAQSPNAIFIILTNPLDTMAFLAKQVTRLPKARVIGQAGVLDSSRMQAFVAMELGVSVENVHAYVMGGHGDEMVPLLRHSNVAGTPLTELFSPERLEAIIDRTRKGGAEIVSLLKTGSAFYAPGAALAQMVDAILKDKHLILPCSTYLEGEYGLRDIYFGVPAQLGRTGVEKVVEYRLTDEEKAALKKSADSVSKSIAHLKQILQPVKN